MTIVLSPKRVLVWLSIVTVLLVGASIAGVVLRFGLNDWWFHGLLPLLDMTNKRSLPTLYATLLLSLCAALLALVALVARGRPFRRHWFLLALVFVFLTADESVTLHARLVFPLQRLLGMAEPLLFAWVIPYGTAVAVLGGLFLPFLRHLPRRWRRWMLLAAGLYLGGALGVEMISGAYYARVWQADLAMTLMDLLEETLEMAGAVVFIYALLGYLGTEFGELRVRIGELRQP